MLNREVATSVKKCKHLFHGLIHKHLCSLTYIDTRIHTNRHKHKQTRKKLTFTHIQTY